MKEPRITALLTDLKLCTMRRDIRWGRVIHAKAVGNRYDSTIYVVTALIKMYANSAGMVQARRVFDSIQNPTVGSWTALLLGYADNGQGHIALGLFSTMKASGYVPDCVTYVAALKACTSLTGNRDGGIKGDCLQIVKEIHSEIGKHLDHHVQNTLIDMYAKCGSMDEAQRVFDSIEKPNVVSWTALLLGYAESGKGQIALDLFSQMKASGCIPDSITYVAALKACTSLAMEGGQGCLERGRKIHSEIGCQLTRYVYNTLIDMYAKLGSMVEACRVFDSIRNPDVVSWNALLMGYADRGEAHATLSLFSKMKAHFYVPDSISYVAALKACTCLAVDCKTRVLEWGREIHSEIGSHLDIYVQNTLVDMYAKGGSMVEASRVFDSIQKPNVVSWTALLLGYAESGEGHIALDLFTRMKARGCVPNSVTYISALKACASLGVNGYGSDKEDILKRGKEIHSEIGCHLDLYVRNSLIDMYAKCGSMVDAREVFDSIQKPDVVLWSALLLGYAENGESHIAIDLFSNMKASGCAPDYVAYVAVLKACGLIGALALGRRFHSEMTEFNTNVVTSLVDFYAKCGSMVEAREVFDLHPSERDVTAWTSLLAGYAKFGDSDSVFSLFKAMQDVGLQPDGVTFLCLLLCCSHAGSVKLARQYLEAMLFQYKVTPTIVHYNCIIDVLGRANQLNEATAMIRKMPCNPDVVTWMSLLSACRKWKNVGLGRGTFQVLVDMDKNNTFAYVLMAQIYGCRGMLEEQERLLETGTKVESPGQAYVTDEVGKMVKFVAGRYDDFPEVEAKLQQLCEEMKKQGICCDVEKDEALCGHCEKRAVVYGILKTSTGEAVRVFKDTRLCEDCHSTTKMISKFSGRILMVRDVSRFHVMENGSCSCGDYW